MKFAVPWMFLLFLPLLVAAWRLLRVGRKSGIRFSAVARLPSRAAGIRAQIAALTPFVLLAGLAMLVVAAARPRTPLAHATRSVAAIALALTVAVSGSMEALDLTPPGEKFSDKTTRLAIVKKLFAEFVERRPDDLIGLVTFGTYASTQSPLTADHPALLEVLKEVSIPQIEVDAQGRQIGDEGESRTAIGDGLATAVLALKNAQPKSKVVILLSDGLNNTGVVQPDEAAAAAAKLGIRVYAIGVGTKSRRTPIFGQDMFGRRSVGYVNLAFDEGQLKSIAQKTGGSYYGVDDTDSLSKALEEIDKLEKTQIAAEKWDEWEEHFNFFLLGGVLAVLLAVTMSMAASRRMA